MYTNPNNTKYPETSYFLLYSWIDLLYRLLKRRFTCSIFWCHGFGTANLPQNPNLHLDADLLRTRYIIYPLRHICPRLADAAHSLWPDLQWRKDLFYFYFITFAACIYHSSCHEPPCIPYWIACDQVVIMENYLNNKAESSRAIITLCKKHDMSLCTFPYHITSVVLMQKISHALYCDCYSTTVKHLWINIQENIPAH